MTALRQKIRRTSELGATAAEYAGVIIAAAILVLALIAAMTPAGERITCEVGSAIDKILGGEGDSCGSASSDNDQYEVDPSNVAKSTTEITQATKGGVKVKAGPGTLGLGVSDSVSAKKTENYDGSGTRSIRKSKGLDVQYSVGTDTVGKGDGGNDFGAKVSASGGVAINQTEEKTWNCGGDGERSCEEFDKANEDATQDQLNNNGFGRVGNKGKEIDEDPAVVSNSVNAKFTVSAEGSDGGNRNAKISGEAGYTYTETVTKDGDGRGDDRRETSHQFSYKGELNGSKTFNKAFGVEGSAGISHGATYSYAGSYKVTYDEDGNLKTIRFTSVAEGVETTGAKVKAGNDDRSVQAGGDVQSSVTVTVTTTLDVSSLSEEDRKTAEDYVSSSLTNGALLVPESALNPSQPSDDEFDNLLHEHAKVTRVTTEGTTVTDNGGFNLWGIGYNDVEETSSTETKGVEVLGEPDSSGVRSYKESDLP